MNWYNELANNGLKDTTQVEEQRPAWATHMFKRMGLYHYGILDGYGWDWIWVNEEKTLYYTGHDIDSGSLRTLTW